MNLWLLVLLLHIAASHKILVYNVKFAHSHGNFLGNIADTLAEAGHNVTSLISEVTSVLDDCTTKSTIIRVPPGPGIEERYNAIGSDDVNFFEINLFNPLHMYGLGAFVARSLSDQCDFLLQHVDLLESLKKEHYDVYIFENFEMCGTGLSELIQAKSMIMVSTTILHGEQKTEVGLPTVPSYDPAAHTSVFDVHSFWSRAWNLYAEYLEQSHFHMIRRAVLAKFRARFGPAFPDFVQISSRIAYSFANTDPLLDVAVPTISRVVDIGGLGTKQPKALNEHWSSILALRPRSVLISFGSLAKSASLHPAAKQSILKVAQAFPDITFIWKYEHPEDEFSSKVSESFDNIVLTKWMPQNDLLNHQRVVLFVTHGGMGSVQETARAGVPAIFVPLFGEQPRNAFVMEKNGFGKVFNKYELHDGDKLVEAVKELLEDESYRLNTRKVARMLARKPFSSRELLLRYVDFAAEFGPCPALRPLAHDMTTVAYYNLDVYLAISIAIIAFIFAVHRITSSVLTGVFRIVKRKVE